MSEEINEAYDNAKDMTMDEAYAYCRRLEEDRQRKHRDTEAGKIETSTLSLDRLLDSFEDASKIQVLSDNGKGKENICASESAEAVSVALSRLPRRDRPFAEAVLQGKTWREMGLSKRTFYWRLKKVEKIFMKSCTHPKKTPA